MATINEAGSHESAAKPGSRAKRVLIALSVALACILCYSNYPPGLISPVYPSAPGPTRDEIENAEAYQSEVKAANAEFKALRDLDEISYKADIQGGSTPAQLLVEILDQLKAQNERLDRLDRIVEAGQKYRQPILKEIDLVKTPTGWHGKFGN